MGNQSQKRASTHFEASCSASRRFVVVVSALILLSAIAAAAVFFLGKVAFASPGLSTELLPEFFAFLPMLLVSCALTGVFEEFLFRGVLFSALWKQSVSRETFVRETCENEKGEGDVPECRAGKRGVFESVSSSETHEGEFRSCGDSVSSFGANENGMHADERILNRANESRANEDSCIPNRTNGSRTNENRINEDRMRESRMRAAILSSVVFALAHALPMVSEVAVAPGAIAIAQVAFKFVQALLFGVCMAALYVAARRIWVPMLVHAFFDLVYFLPDAYVFGAFPQSYATGNLLDLAAIMVSVVVLLLPTIKSLHYMKDGVLLFVSGKKQQA